MKNKRKQSPTLAELLDPFLRNPPSPPPSTVLQVPQSLMPVPGSPPTASVSTHDCSRRCTGADRRFVVDTPQFYCVHPRDFRSLVQRLTGEIRSTTSTNDQHPSMLEERQVTNIQNVDVDVDHTDFYTMLPVLSPRTMDAVGGDASMTESKKKGECSTYRGCFPP